MSNREKIFYAAVFILLKKDGKYLLQKRMNTGFMDGCYDAGASGHVEPGEHVTISAIREAKEEVGVDIAHDDMKLIRVVQMNIDKPYISFVYVCKKWTGEIAIGEVEKIEELVWCTPEEIPENVTRIMSLLKATDFAEELEFEYIDRARLAEIIPGDQATKLYYNN